MPSKELISGEWKKVCSKADCHKAGIPQPIEGFSKSKNTSDGLQYKCKKCANLHYFKNKDQILKRVNKRYEKKREEILIYQEKYRSENKSKIAKRDKEYARKNRDKINEYLREYRKEPSIKMAHYVSTRIRDAIKKTGGQKGGITFDYLPYSREELKKHLEKQFDEHMTWDNHGTYWHIDHIKPHVMFNYDSLDHPDFQKCWDLKNLQPLEARENLKKNSFYEGKRHYHNEEV